MKTPQQKKFEKLITNIILCEPFINSRAGVLEDFRFESEHCYDIFCDKIFEIVYVKHRGILLIDERGYTYLGERPNTPHHVFFQLLSDEDLKSEADDIIFYIELALNHLEEQVYKIQKSFCF